MSLEQIISEQTLATRDLTAAVSQLAEVIKLAGLTSVSIPATLEATLTGPATAVSAQIPAATPTPTFNATEVAADPLAQTAQAQASPAPVASTAAAAPTAAPAPSVESHLLYGTPVTQDQFLAVMKAYGNGVLPNGMACERAPDGFLKGVLAEVGAGNFRDVPQVKFAEILLKVPVAIRHSIVAGG